MGRELTCVPQCCPQPRTSRASASVLRVEQSRTTARKLKTSEERATKPSRRLLSTLLVSALTLRSERPPLWRSTFRHRQEAYDVLGRIAKGGMDQRLTCVDALVLQILEAETRVGRSEDENTPRQGGGVHEARSSSESKQTKETNNYCEAAACEVRRGTRARSTLAHSGGLGAERMICYS